MAADTSLTEALRAFAAAEQRIVDHDRLGDAGNAAELVRLRRDLVMAFAQVAAALESDPGLRAQPDRQAQATRLLSAFRTQNAVNQADWPAIRIPQDRDAYHESVARVQARSRAFWDWVGEELGVRP